MKTLEEYKELLKAAEAEYNKKRVEIARQYAYSNNPYKCGDILQDHHTIIKVEIIGLYFSLTDPSCKYTGVELKKDLTPTKKQLNTVMYQGNVEAKLN